MIVLDLSILNQKGTPMFNSDLTANRPAAGIVGRIFIAIDSPYGIFRDTGTAWDQVSSAGGGATLYSGDGTLSGNRVVSSGGFNLTFAPQTTFSSSLTAATGGSSYAVLGSNALSFAAGFSSSNIGNVYSANGAINLQNFLGNATFAQANLASANVSVNSIDFGSGGHTITMTQSTGIRAMTGHQSQIQFQGSHNGTISHAAISQNLGFYRAVGSTRTLTITNAYSLLLNDLDDYGGGFTFTNRWGIYQAGVNDRNFFAAASTFGERLNVESDSTITTQVSSAIVSTTTNANLIISPNGTGALLASIPDGTLTGGNARGLYAIDLQRIRSSVNQIVASYTSYGTILNGSNNTCNANYSQVLNGSGNTINFANYSSVLNGTNCQTSGDYSIASGQGCTSNAYGFSHGFNNVNSGTASISLGWSSTVSNSYSFACGFQNQATGLSSFVSGYRGIAYLRSQITNGYTPQSWGSPFYGLAQSSSIVASSPVVALTTGATTDLTIDGDLIIPSGNNRSWNVQIKYVAVVSNITGTATGLAISDTKSQNVEIGLKKYVGTSALVGAGVYSTAQESASMNTASIAISIGASQDLRLTFTAPTFVGGGSLTMRVVAKVELTEVAY